MAQQGDELPSSEGLQIDWDYRPANPHGKRAHARIDEKELARLFAGQRISVTVAIAATQYVGALRDIGEGGLAVRLGNRLNEQQTVTVGFFLGTEKIIAHAQVKHVQPGERGFITGLMFLSLNRVARRHIAEVYASKVLRHVS